MSKNRVLDKLHEVSEELHNMEMRYRVEFNNEEEKTWSRLTLLLLEEKEEEEEGGNVETD